MGSGKEEGGGGEEAGALAREINPLVCFVASHTCPGARDLMGDPSSGGTNALTTKPHQPGPYL